MGAMREAEPTNSRVRRVQDTPVTARGGHARGGFHADEAALLAGARRHAGVHPRPGARQVDCAGGGAIPPLPYLSPGSASEDGSLAPFTGTALVQLLTLTYSAGSIHGSIPSVSANGIVPPLKEVSCHCLLCPIALSLIHGLLSYESDPPGHGKQKLRARRGSPNGCGCDVMTRGLMYVWWCNCTSPCAD